MALELDNIKDAIGEKTLLPISIVVLICYILIAWTHLSDKVENQALAQGELNKKMKVFQRVDRRLFRIEEKLHIEHPKDDDGQ